ncbi:MAG: hypothetical protein L6R38_007737, partial [Xanthoria sp. 2 TBL-2021]
MNDQPPPYEEISSAPVYDNLPGSVPILDDEKRNAVLPSSSPTTGGALNPSSDNAIANNPTDRPSANEPNNKLLIPSTRPTILHFPYHHHLSHL